MVSNATEPKTGGGPPDASRPRDETVTGDPGDPRPSEAGRSPEYNRRGSGESGPVLGGAGSESSLMRAAHSARSLHFGRNDRMADPAFMADPHGSVGPATLHENRAQNPHPRVTAPAKSGQEPRRLPSPAA